MARRRLVQLPAALSELGRGWVQQLRVDEGRQGHEHREAFEALRCVQRWHRSLGRQNKRDKRDKRDECNHEKKNITKLRLKTHTHTHKFQLRCPPQFSGLVAGEVPPSGFGPCAGLVVRGCPC